MQRGRVNNGRSAARLVGSTLLVMGLHPVCGTGRAGAADGTPELRLPVLSEGAAPAESGRDLSLAPRDIEASDASQPAATSFRRPMLWAALLSTGVVGGAALNSFTDNPTGGFHVTEENWFGEHTYVGGADKASHFVSFGIIARELATIYQYLGVAPKPALLGGFGPIAWATG